MNTPAAGQHCFQARHLHNREREREREEQTTSTRPATQAPVNLSCRIGLGPAGATYERLDTAMIMLLHGRHLRLQKSRTPIVGILDGLARLAEPEKPKNRETEKQASPAANESGQVARRCRARRRSASQSSLERPQSGP